MHWLANIAEGIKSLFHKSRSERELDEELEGFVAASVEHKLRSGMAEKAARRAALVEIGSP